MFRPIAPRTARWRPAEGDGLQQVDIRPVAGRIDIDGVVVGTFEGHDFGACFHIECDPDWRTRSFRVETTAGLKLSLSSDGTGRWHDTHGRALPQFDGCIDVDLSGSPFTNTLPIRRLNPTPASGPVELLMLYVPFDTFEPFPDGQRYTCIGDRHFRYAATDGTFDAEIWVDQDGLVTDYPLLFRRVENDDPNF